MWQEEKAFGLVLRDHRKRVGISQETLAFEADLARNYVSQLELGQKSPSLRTIFRLCRVLGTQPTDFIRDVESELSTISPGVHP